MTERTILKFLGTGTSQGVPMIGCGCDVCRSRDPRDKRLRASVLVEHEGLAILVDAGPDFRQQMLREGVSHLDAILLTHNHKDHTGGLDDIRAFNYLEKRATEIYCEKYVEDALRMEYSYAFAEKKYPGAPEWHVHNIDENPFEIRCGGNKSLVCALLELLTAVLVLVNRTENCDDLLVSWKRNRTGYLCAVFLSCIHDLFSGSVNQLVVVTLNSYSDLLTYCHFAFLLIN